MLAEVALWSLWASKLGHDRVRGGRWNMGIWMPFPPREIRELERRMRARARNSTRREMRLLELCAGGGGHDDQGGFRRRRHQYASFNGSSAPRAHHAKQYARDKRLAQQNPCHRDGDRRDILANCWQLD